MTGRSAAGLPRVMVAPNGARRGPADHPALPVTIPQIVATARACHAAGAGGIHAHVRDAQGVHTLDAGLYRELIAELATAVPDMLVQITTEAVGRYTPAEQRALVSAVAPTAASVALREMLADGDTGAAGAFYHQAADTGVAIQHILYTPDELRELFAWVAADTIPPASLQALFVIGHYAAGQDSDPADLAPYLEHVAAAPCPLDWAVCAFGRSETACLTAAAHRGGKVRVGFENNLVNADGSVAPDNAARVAEVVAAI